MSISFSSFDFFHGISSIMSLIGSGGHPIIDPNLGEPTPKEPEPKKE